MAFKILSLDGGGIRGLMVTILLERLDKAAPGWRDDVKLIAGTSTGGIIAIGLAAGLSPTDLRKLYEERGGRIFDDSFLDNLLDLGQLVGAQYDNDNLRAELKKVVGATTKLGDLKKRVLIPAFDLDNEAKKPSERTWKPKIFHNLPGADSDAKQLAWKVALYTASAPTYFPSTDGYIDGGVYANNPSMCALAQALDRKKMKPTPKLSDIRLLSIGTGRSQQSIQKKTVDWGFTQWAKPLISIMYDGVSGIADYQCQQLLGKDQYRRIDPALPAGESFPLDGIDKIPDLVRFAEGVRLTTLVNWLNKKWA